MAPWRQIFIFRSIRRMNLNRKLISLAKPKNQEMVNHGSTGHWTPKMFILIKLRATYELSNRIYSILIIAIQYRLYRYIKLDGTYNMSHISLAENRSLKKRGTGQFCLITISVPTLLILTYIFSIWIMLNNRSNGNLIFSKNKESLIFLPKCRKFFCEGNTPVLKTDFFLIWFSRVFESLALFIIW